MLALVLGLSLHNPVLPQGLLLTEAQRAWTPSFTERQVVAPQPVGDLGYTTSTIPGGQTWGYILPPRMFIDHPEYFAQIDGIRQPYGWPCTTNPAVVRVFADYIIRYFNENPDPVFPLSPADNLMVCGCPNCVQLDPIPGQYSDRVVQFCNEVISLVERSHRGKKYSLLAYSSYHFPPVKQVPHPDISILICRIGPMGYAMADADLRSTIRGWGAHGNQVVAYDYVGDYKWYGLLPILGGLSKSYKIYKEEGITVVQAECHPHWATQGRELWAAQMLAWHSDWTPEYLTRRWCEAMFGKASAIMIEFYNLVDALEPVAVHGGGAYLPANLPAEFTDKLADYLLEALRLVRKDKEATAHLRLLRMGLRFTVAFSEGLRLQRLNQHKKAVNRLKEAKRIVLGAPEYGWQKGLVIPVLNHMIATQEKK